MSLEKPLLIALDGSERGLDMVRQFRKWEPFRKMPVVLFHVFSQMPECYWDLERDPARANAVEDMRQWEARQQKAVASIMERAVKMLTREGFSKDRIETKIVARKRGIARDIIREARRGCAAVVIRRHGFSKIPSLVMGSVSSKLLDRIDFAPLMIAGKEPPTRRLLVGIDGSKGAMRAVEFVGSMLGGAGYEAVLAYVFREDDGMDLNPVRRDLQAALDEAKKHLVNAGFLAQNVLPRILTGAKSRAEALVREAEASGANTIVMGRRGWSQVEEFTLGRVPRKVIVLARKKSVWLVH